MRQMKYLFALLVVYKHNLQILHWKSSGVGFDAIHKITDEYADKFNSLIDSIAENLIILEDIPLSLIDCITVLNETNTQYLLVSPEMNYSKHEVFTAIQRMFKDLITRYVVIIHGDKYGKLPTGMKSGLESDLQWFEIECNYKIKLRLK